MIMDLYPTYGDQVRVVELRVTSHSASAQETDGSPATHTSGRPLPQFFRSCQPDEDATRGGCVIGRGNPGYDTSMQGRIGPLAQHDHRSARTHHVDAHFVPELGGWVAVVDSVGYAWVPDGMSSPLQPDMSGGVADPPPAAAEKAALPPEAPLPGRSVAEAQPRTWSTVLYAVGQVQSPAARGAELLRQALAAYERDGCRLRSTIFNRHARARRVLRRIKRNEEHFIPRHWRNDLVQQHLVPAPTRMSEVTCDGGTCNVASGGLYLCLPAMDFLMQIAQRLNGGLVCIVGSGSSRQEVMMMAANPRITVVSFDLFDQEYQEALAQCLWAVSCARERKWHTCRHGQTAPWCAG